MENLKIKDLAERKVYHVTFKSSSKTYIIRFSHLTFTSSYEAHTHIYVSSRIRNISSLEGELNSFFEYSSKSSPIDIGALGTIKNIRKASLAEIAQLELCERNKIYVDPVERKNISFYPIY